MYSIMKFNFYPGMHEHEPLHAVSGVKKKWCKNCAIHRTVVLRVQNIFLLLVDIFCHYFSRHKNCSNLAWNIFCAIYFLCIKIFHLLLGSVNKWFTSAQCLAFNTYCVHYFDSNGTKIVPVFSNINNKCSKNNDLI